MSPYYCWISSITSRALKVTYCVPKLQAVFSPVWVVHPYTFVKWFLRPQRWWKIPTDFRLNSLFCHLLAVWIQASYLASLSFHQLFIYKAESGSVCLRGLVWDLRGKSQRPNRRRPLCEWGLVALSLSWYFLIPSAPGPLDSCSGLWLNHQHSSGVDMGVLGGTKGM